MSRWNVAIKNSTCRLGQAVEHVILPSKKQGFVTSLTNLASTLSRIKSPEAHANVDPNRIYPVFGSNACRAKVFLLVWRETHELGELVGSSLYQVHLYHWLEA